MQTFFVQIENTRLTWHGYRADSIPDIASMWSMRGVDAVSVQVVLTEAAQTPLELYPIVDYVESWSRPLCKL